MEQSVVEWCEAYTDQYLYSNYIAEYSNTISNLAFIFISLLSIYQFNHQLFQRCNIVLLLSKFNRLVLILEKNYYLLFYNRLDYNIFRI